MWQIKGIAKNITNPIIASYSHKSNILNWIKPKYIKETKKINEVYRFASISMLEHVNTPYPIIYNLPEEGMLDINDGDILKLCPDGTVKRVFNASSTQNVLFVTEACNSQCIMCPQPQTPLDYSDEVLEILSCIPKKSLREICISGGEPTVGIKIFEIMETLKRSTYVEPIILTNGRKFNNKSFTQSFIDRAPFNTVYAIPLYSSIPEVHDRIVGVSGAFRETINGIYNLSAFRVPIEIRIVLTSKNVFNLTELANFIGWNLPMAVHVALMGMEVCGRAYDNIEDVWIEPKSYMQELIEATKILDYRDIPVSIYNLPLCLLPYEIRKYSTFSISQWKQGFIPECQSCTMRDECNGIFTSSKKIPDGIHAI